MPSIYGMLWHALIRTVWKTCAVLSVYVLSTLYVHYVLGIGTLAAINAPQAYSLLP